MNQEHAEKIRDKLPPEAMVIDVGGGMAAFERADWIIDAIDFEDEGCLLERTDQQREVRFTSDTWVKFDICSRRPWPFKDKQFDYAVCSHVLEDVRDPIWVCSEISRIAKAGYIETPSRTIEQSTGVEHPGYAGYYHHRWLVSVNEGKLEFRHKPHLLHSTNDAIVARLRPWNSINPNHEIVAHHWEDDLAYSEVLDFDEDDVVKELCAVAKRARQVPSLLVRSPSSLPDQFRRAAYFARLKLGRR